MADRKRKPYCEWTTRHEITFLEGLGRHALKKGEPPKNKSEVKKLLKNYKESLKKRIRWGRIERGRVDLHLEGMLKSDRR